MNQLEEDRTKSSSTIDLAIAPVHDNINRPVHNPGAVKGLPSTEGHLPLCCVATMDSLKTDTAGTCTPRAEFICQNYHEHFILLKNFKSLKIY